MSANAFNFKGKTSAQLGQELVAELSKGQWAADEGFAIQLVKAGADLEQTDKDGNTALLVASIQGLPKAGVEIVNAGANVNATNKRGDSALTLTLAPPSMAMDQAWEDFLPIADAVLAKKPNVNIANQYDQTPLIMAADQGLFRYVAKILELKPNLSVVEQINYRTAQQAAEKNPYGDATVKLLKDAKKAFGRGNKNIPVLRTAPTISFGR